MTALHWTASSPHGDTLIPMMVARGANVDAVDNYGRTALHLLAGLGRINGATCLLYHGADVSIRDDDDGLLSIDYAIIHGHDDVVKLLLAYGAKPTEPNPSDRIDSSVDYRNISTPPISKAAENGAPDGGAVKSP
jgi:ankyrin repeat protein